MSITNLVNQNPQNDSFQNTSNTCNNNDNDPLCNYFENEGNTTLQNIKMNVGNQTCYLKKVDSNLELDFLRGNNKLAEFTCGEGAKQRGDVYKVEKSGNKYTIKDQDVKLTVTEFLILQSLCNRTGIVKNRDQLMDAAYGETIYVDDRTIDSHIKRLRKKFRMVDSSFDQIETLYGVGYRYRE